MRTMAVCDRILVAGRFRQVSAMAVVYPMEGTVSPDSGISVESTGSSGTGFEPRAAGSGATPDRYLGSATVTITWAIS
jgi:hypothetical protein